MNEYSIDNHIHNYAVWTAARAVQRGFAGATTESISKAIDMAGLRNKFLESKSSWNDEEFKKTHEEIIEKIKSELKGCSYGRAAKIIAIYIKTAVILPNIGEGQLSKVAYPPIDNILLTNLKKEGIIKSIPNWTQIEDSNSFLELIDNIKTALKKDEPLWKIEQYWLPNKAL